MTGQLAYLIRLARSVFTVRNPGKHSTWLIIPAIVLTMLLVAGALRAPATALATGTTQKTPIDFLTERTRDISRRLAQVDSIYFASIEPIERVLLHYRDDPALARRIATALFREAQRVDLEPQILLAVLLVENPWLKPSAVSPVGALGLMQVMPWHSGRWSACNGPLIEIETNICYGAQIFAANLRDTNGNVERALLRYNGCVSGTNTPNCHEYPQHVFARAGRATILQALTHRKPQ